LKGRIYPIKSPTKGREKCQLCGRLKPIRYLRRCDRCKRLFCGSCIIESPLDATRIVCLECARKLVSFREVTSKYDRLRSYLVWRAEWADWSKLSFKKIEEIMGEELPSSAKTNERWWSNSEGASHARAWLDAGWNVSKVDLEKQIVIFKRVLKKGRRKRVRRKAQSKVADLPEFKPTKAKKPSLTKIAWMQARLKNIERKKRSPKKWKIKT